MLLQLTPLCPSPKKISIHYYMPFTAALLYIFLTSFIYSPPEFDLLNFGFNVLNVLVCFRVANSTRWIYYLLHISFASVVSLAMVTRYKENVFSYLGFAFIFPQFALIGSSNLLIYIIFVLTQIFVFQYKLKAYILEGLRMNELDPFLQSFLSLGVILYLFFMLSYGTAIHALRTQTLELEKHMKSSTEASERQKLYLLGFSHELRNPINSLLGNLQLSLLEKISEEARNTLQTAKLCGDILLQQVNNMLDGGKLEAGTLEIQHIPTRVHEITQSVWAIFSQLIKRKNLLGNLRIDKSMPTLLSLDPYRVNQILLNLIGNAIKFTEKGAINISLHWLENASVSDRCFEPVPYNEEDEGLFEKDEKVAMFGSNTRLGLSSNCYVLTHDRKTFSLEEMKFSTSKVPGVLKIVVRDTGNGMNEVDRASIFKKFCQVSDNIQCRQLGTGLGLYITDEICKRMGGLIKVYSKRGVGTTFIVCIPTYSLPANASVQHRNLSPVLDVLQERKIQVIAAGDSTGLVSDYVRKLQGTLVAVVNNGYSAYLAYTEALQKGRKIDAVIIEADMQKMDGKLTYQKIRKYEQENGLKPVSIVIVHNAESFGNIEPDVRSLLMDGVKEIKKPLYFEDFCNTLSSLITESQTTRVETLSSFESLASLEAQIKARRSSTN